MVLVVTGIRGGGLSVPGERTSKRFDRPDAVLTLPAAACADAVRTDGAPLDPGWGPGQGVRPRVLRSLVTRVLDRVPVPAALADLDRRRAWTARAPPLVLESTWS